MTALKRIPLAATQPVTLTRQTSLAVLIGPLIFFELYLLMTILLFRYGPWQYFNKSSNEILFFALLYQLALAAGYFVAHGIYRRPPLQKVNINQLITVSIVANLLIFPLTSLGRTGELFPNVLAGLGDPGNAYTQSLIYRETGVGAVFEYLRIILGPLLYLYFPLAVFYWGRLSKKIRFWTVMLVLLNIALFIAMGTNKAIGDYAVTVPLLMLTAIAAGNLRLTLKRLLLGFVLVVGLVGMFGSFFSATMTSRAGSSIASGYFPAGNTRVDRQHPLLQGLPEAGRPLVVGLSNYITQGYFAMGLALREPFVPMYGLGTSPFVLRQYEALTGTTGLEEQTYPTRITKYGWLKDQYWSSMYLWLASDLSFWGIPFFCFFLGMVLYTSWRDTIETHNLWALNLVALNIIVLFYFSSNNQIGQAGEPLWTYIVVFFLWLSSRRGIRFTLASRGSS
ncbi:hypothetical protein [Deinococcus aquatilis]|uniref:hypothetical protein n=1 Tax=Deinococcus aquatilis TaxID=519440 RepID=UPI00036FBEDD|nr:hypothetical protein [Deinococcus aquatilis]